MIAQPIPYLPHRPNPRARWMNAALKVYAVLSATAALVLSYQVLQ